MAVVISPEGRRAIRRQGYPFAPTTGYTYGGSPLTQSVGLSGQLRASYGYIYRTQPWVYVVINKLAETIANLPLHAFPQAADGTKGPKIRPGDDAAGRLAQLIRRPTPTTSEFDFKYALVTEYLTYGHFLGVKVSGGALPSELWPVPWYCVEVVEGVSRPIDGYRITLGGKVYPFLPEEVVHLQAWKGISPLEPLRRTLGIEDAALREIASAFENAMRIQGLLIAGPNGNRPAPKLTSADTTLIREEFEAAYGGVDRAYRAAVIGGGFDWKPLQFSHTESELIPIRQMAREEVAAAFNVPPPMIGILDKATYSNYEQAARSYYQDSVAPKLVKIEEGLEVQLLAPEPEWRGLDLEFSLDEVLKSSLSDRAEAYTKLTRVGFSLNHILHMENEPEVNEPFYRTAWVPQELMPAAADAQELWKATREKPEGPPPVPPDQQTQGLLAAILGRLEADPPPPAPPQAVTVNNAPAPIQLTIEGTEVHIPEAPAPVVNVSPAKAPDVQVTVEAPTPAKTRRKVIRDRQGQITGTEDE